MGDRCYLSVTLRKKDVKDFGAAFTSGWCYTGDWWNTIEEGDMDTSEDEPVTLGVEEVNYGGERELLDAAEAGFSFYGEHSSGSCYGPQLFACHKGVFKCVDLLPDSGGPAVPVCMETGKLLKEHLKSVREFLRLRKKAKAFIEKG